MEYINVRGSDCKEVHVHVGRLASLVVNTKFNCLSG